MLATLTVTRFLVMRRRGKDLALPFEQRLFFAGEATHTDDFLTAHGAYESALRAAEEVIAALARHGG